MDGDRIMSTRVINGFSEGSINKSGFKVNECLLDIRDIGEASVDLKLIYFCVEKEHDGISPPLTHKLCVVDKIARWHSDSAVLMATCEGRVRWRLPSIRWNLGVIVVITIFIAPAMGIISEFSLG
jgi:hypothetical protein